MVKFVRFLAWLTARRAGASWRLTLASGFGVLLAVTLASAAAVHSGTLAEAGLRYAVANAPSRAGLNLQLVVQDRPLGRQDYERLRSVADGAVQAHLGWLSSGMHRLGLSQLLPFVTRSDETPPQGGPVAYAFFQDEFQEHARLVSGRWPQGSPGVTDEGFLSLEVAVGAEAAGTLGWAEGARRFLVPFATAPEEKVAITVVGIMEPADPEEAYWFGNLSRFRIGQEGGTVVAPLYAGEEGFFDGMGAHYPMLLGTYWWYVSLNVESLTAATALRVRDSLEALEADINRAFPRSLVMTMLDGLIADYQRSLSLARVPLFLFTFLVVGVVLYYLVVITVMLARNRGAEAAMMRSRGATVFQVGALLGLGEGLAVAVPASLVGPFLGWGLASVLPAGGQGLERPSVGLSPSVFAIAAVAGLVCVAVFLAAGTGVAGRGIVQFLRERARPPDRPAVYRYAIDLLALAAVGLVWWQIRGRGGFLTERLLGKGLEVDPSLLVGPALALLAVGLLLLRVLPLLLRLLARLADPVGPIWLAHGLKRMARDHFACGTLAVLLMLATALGVFGAALGATLSRSQADQARYAVGGEIVAPPPKLAAYESTQEPGKALVTVPGVLEVVPVHRGTVTSAGGSYGGATYSLLAVDPATLPHVTWFREDFAGKGVNELLRPLRQPSPFERGTRLPEEAKLIGVWARAERPYPSYSLWLRLRDAAGEYESLRLSNLGVGSWTYMETSIPEDLGLQQPLTLVAIYISGGPFAGYGGGSLALDEVTAVVGGERRVIEGFESAGPWLPLPNLGVAKDTLAYEGKTAHSGKAGALFSWTEPISGSVRGLFVPPVPMPIPAIGSAGFGVGQELVGRIGGQPVGLLVRDVAEYFPTLYSDEYPFLIVNRDHLDWYLSVLPLFLTESVKPNEFWLGLKEGADRALTLEALRDVVPRYSLIRHREEQAERAAGNPLTGGAWGGLALLATVALGGVAITGFGLYVVLAVQRTRVELGVLQALGLSRWRVGLVLALEGLMVAAVGVGVGGVAGGWVGRWTLGYLGVTAAGRPVVPPMELALDGRLAALALGEVALAAALATLLALVLATRLRLHEVLRVEE